MDEQPNGLKNERELHKIQLDQIRKDIHSIKVEGRWISAIQIGAIVLVFFFGVQTLKDLKNKILK